ncbi:enoyl-CoA hydratase/isomerase family protein [Herbiconiux sp. SALV-R1]|uniref:enoyl-CoA hydratase/isomerase family protein n=1 Tax=Herbiconiux sp. SALV-R1 TaxID=2735133 RepID=UPI0020A490C6|nr:enoyl-CoA hydratase/isomerase family protein [Herbiconiux sp. SALV-R1]
MSIAGLEQDLRTADADSEVTGILIEGGPEMFCGGLDLASIRSPEDSVELAAALADLLRVMPRLSKPVAASAEGDALASGASLLCCTDYAACRSGISIGTVEAGKGIWPMVAQVPLLHRVGARAAMENLASGIPFPAERARELGLVNIVTDDPRAAAVAWLRAASRGGEAARRGRPLAYHLADLDYDRALDTALTHFSSMFRKDHTT